MRFITMCLIFASITWAASGITDCDVLEKPGEYIVTNDIELSEENTIDTSYYGPGNSCILINTSRVTIDLNGHRMSCSALFSEGRNAFFLVKGEEVTIKNGIIDNCAYGVYPFSNPLLLAENLTALDTAVGIYAERTINCTFINNSEALRPGGDVIGNYFFGNEIAVFCLGQCRDAVISGNTFENNNLGINIYGGKTDIPENINIVNNVFSDNVNDCNETTWLGEPFLENHCRFYSLKNTTDKNVICFAIAIIALVVAGAALKLKSTKALPR